MPAIHNDISNTIRTIQANPGTRGALFQKLPPNEQARIALLVPKRLAYELLSALSDNELVLVAEHLDSDEATDILQLFPEEKRSLILNRLDRDIKAAVEKLLHFDPETAGGLMDTNYIQVGVEETIASVAKQFRQHEKRTGRPPAILVLDSAGRLTGHLPGYKLGLALPENRAGEFVQRIRTAHHSASSDEVIDIFRRNPHDKIVVLGDSHQVLGVVYSDDVLRVLREQEGAALYDFAGVHEEETVSDTVLIKVRSRYKWLIINLATAFLAAFTVSLFDETISKYVLLAVYMPIVAGMGGNAATQTLAVMVRGIALKQIDLKTAWRTICREVGAGLVNGLINGVIVAVAVMLIDRDMKVGLILAVAMVVNLLVAAFFGTIVPLIMERFGKDPATSATIFITTATDVLGFLAFLGLATLVLN